MKTNETILAKATKTRACPKTARQYGRRDALITITAQAYLLGGNAHPHFSVTADIYAPGRADDPFACGCLHDEALRFWPEIAPIVRLHLSNADDGEPMYAVENGWYNMAGALGGADERYHRGNSEMHFPCVAPADKPWKDTQYRMPTEDECLAICAEHLRVPLAEAEALRVACREAFERGAGAEAARAVFAQFVEAQRGRWKAEAAEGLALIKRLSGQAETVNA